jgi:hypothetical protein
LTECRQYEDARICLREAYLRSERGAQRRWLRVGVDHEIQGVHSRGELGLVSAGDPFWVWRALICVAGAGVAVFARVR